MTKKKVSSKTLPQPSFHQGQRVIYDGWDQLGEVHNISAVIACAEEADDILQDDDDGRIYSRKNPKKLAWWYHVTLVGDRYPRLVCEDELSPMSPPKFRLGNLVDFTIPHPKRTEEYVGGSGIVVGVYEDDGDLGHTYDVWIKSGNLAAGDVKTPFRMRESALKQSKGTKTKKGK